MLLVGFASGGRRRSEIAGLTINDLVSDGDGFLWKLGRTKNSKGELEDVHKPIQDEAAAALKEWLAVSGITEGSVFREIDWRGVMTQRPMSDQAVYRTVKRLAAVAGLKGAWGAHSLRSGFMTEAGRRRESMHEAMALSGHKSALVAGRYYRAQHASNSPAANFTAGMKLPDRTPAPALPAKPARATHGRKK